MIPCKQTDQHTPSKQKVTCISFKESLDSSFLIILPKCNYVHPTGGWTYYFCFFRRPTWFPDILGNSSYPIFTKFGMQVYWVNRLYGIAFGDVDWI